MAKLFDTGAAEIFFYKILIDPWACVNRKYIFYIVLIFYPGFLHCSEGSSHWEVALKIGALKI